MVYKVGDEPGPARLVRSAAAAAIVAVEIFVEEDVVLEIGVGLQLCILSENGTPPVSTAKKKLYEAATQLISDFVEREHNSRSSRAVDPQPITIELMEAAQVFDQQIVDRHPNRTAPIRVAAKQSAVGLSRKIFHSIVHPVVLEIVGIVEVAAG